MRTVKWSAFLAGLYGFAVVLGLMAASARADVTTERGASIVIFPKVIVAGDYDTVIQITNISNDLVYARCFYVNAQLTKPEEPEHPILNPPLWLETDFNIRLTRKQPTHWVASSGRGVNPFDTGCASDKWKTPACCDMYSCPAEGIDLNETGIDPGAVPPVVEDFIGELKCVEVDASGTPIGGNHLKGEATIKGGDGDESDVSKYNAIGIEGTDLAGAAGDDLWLNNRQDIGGGMYNACPARLILNHFAEGAENPVAGEGSSVSTELTIVPCSQNFEDQIPATVTLQFKVYNEFETPFSTSTSVTCWKNIKLTDIGPSNVFDYDTLGSTVAQTYITPADAPDGGFIGVAEEFHSLSNTTGAVSRAAFNIHTEGDRFFGEDGTQFDRVILSGVQ